MRHRVGWLLPVGLLLAGCAEGGAVSLPDDGDSLMQLVYLLCLLALVWFGVGRGQSFGRTVRYLAIYAALMLALILGYSYRHDVRDAYQRIRAELIPGMPVTASDGSVTLVRGRDGHFSTSALVNGAGAFFLIDTGASSVVLPFEVAERVGYTPETLNFSQQVRTANGVAWAAPIRIDRVEVGGIVVENVPAMVSEAGRLDTALLGMSFLRRLRRFSIENDRLTMEQ